MTLSALAVSTLTLGNLILQIILQMVVAGQFGAGYQLDAFYAALTIPQFAQVVVIGAIGAVFLPELAGAHSSQGEPAFWSLARRLVAQVLLTFLALGVVSTMLAGPILKAIAPDLAGRTIDLAVRLTPLIWLATLGTVMALVTTSVYHARGNFRRAALAAIAGSAGNVAAVALLAGPHGVTALAIGLAANGILQAALLAPILLHRHPRPADPLRPRTTGTWRLAFPLLVSGLFIRITPVLDRFLAASFDEGTIAQVGYGSRLIAMAAVMISTGIGSVIFPRLSFRFLDESREAFASDTFVALRVIWLFVVPTIAGGMLLGGDAVRVLLERGAFGRADTEAVSGLLVWYMPALIGTAAGAVTGKALYALRASKTVAVGGTIEALAYIAYTVLLVRSFGVIGLAIGFSLHNILSSGWHLLFVLRAVGFRTLVPHLRPSLMTLMAGIGAAAATWLAVPHVPTGAWRLFVGAAVLLVSYLAMLLLLPASEFRALARSFRSKPVTPA